MSDNKVAVREPSLVEVMAQIVSLPSSDGMGKVAMMERVIAMKERAEEREAKRLFSVAMTELQAELPQIDKRGKILERDSQKVRSTYARIEELDGQIRPYLAKHGFAFSYDTEPAPAAGEIRISGTMTHSAGHFEVKKIDMPIDTGGAKSKVQERSSTLSVGIRNLLRMHLNLIMRDVDDDGQGNAELITAKDLAIISELLTKIGTEDALPKVLAWLKAEKLEDIQRRDVGRALAFLRAKVTEKKS